MTKKKAIPCKKPATYTQQDLINARIRGRLDGEKDYLARLRDALHALGIQDLIEEAIRGHEERHHNPHRDY